MSAFRGLVHGLGTPLILVLLAGCKTTHTLDAAQHTDAATAAQTDTHEVRSEGPEHIIMTVEEFSQLCDPQKEPPVAFAERGGGLTEHRPAGQADTTAVAPHAQVLVRRTVTVTDRGPSLDDLRTISSLQSKLNNSTEIHTKDESKPGGIFSLWWLVSLLPLVAGVLIWRLKPSLFGVALGALKGLLK